LLLLLPLTFTDGRAVEILFAMSKTETDPLQMATKTNRATARHYVKREQLTTFHTVC
jgi:hypothetical protein